MASGKVDMVMVKIKDNAEDVHEFPVHKAFICYYSPFFDAAFNGKFIESQTQMVELDDVSPVAFGIFVNWLYTQRINMAGEERILITFLSSLWLLAD